MHQSINVSSMCFNVLRLHVSTISHVRLRKKVVTNTEYLISCLAYRLCNSNGCIKRKGWGRDGGRCRVLSRIWIWIGVDLNVLMELLCRLQE